MHVTSLQLQQFRNIPELDLSCPEDLHLFVGANAQGKTNLLESLYMISLGKSHRARSLQECIRFGEQTAMIRTRTEARSKKNRLELKLLPKGRKIKKNGLEVAKLSQYIGTLPVVLFAPEDLQLVKGGPQVRRKFLDVEIGQISPAYVHHLTQLKNLLKERNQLLKNLSKNNTFPLTFLDVLDEQLIELSVSIWRKRIESLARLQEWAEEIHLSITKGEERLRIEYIPSVPIHAQMSEQDMKHVMLKSLEKVRKKEIILGNTLLGPHRDDFSLQQNKLDYHTFGSQGQQRTAALSLKLAELQLVKEAKGNFPVLLLDDVLSELDDSRKTHLLESIRGRVQTFVTATGLDGIDLQTQKQAVVYHVKNGHVTRA
ncbi:DNA replication/repair protein RecF [Shimazuella alba]|uniref:DNA replication and repair protein RecF n=1 Tax=Shimazuella alba TaxID=2690964 RepID=A0A6I4VS61_9BACL|nr:DNA replication/repair protein RecF [Shimazuella alba]MXQ53085.1 DNA replication/repair protein RecF [Shimazuella alba]